MSLDELIELRDFIALSVTKTMDGRWSSEQNNCSVAVFEGCQRAVRYCLQGTVKNPAAYIKRATWTAAERYYKEAQSKRREFSNQAELEIQDMRSLRGCERGMRTHYELS